MSELQKTWNDINSSSWFCTKSMKNTHIPHIINKTKTGGKTQNWVTLLIGFKHEKFDLMKQV